MAKIIVGRWGRSLAIRVPQEVAQAAGLTEGERIDIEAEDGDIRIRRSQAEAEAAAAARAAAEAIIADRSGHRLGGLSIRDLLEEGRRG
jgi:antitoxin MazE